MSMWFDGKSGTELSDTSSRSFLNTVRDILQNAFESAWKSRDTTNLRERAHDLLIHARKQYGDNASAHRNAELENSIASALFDAGEHSGEFAVISEEALKSSASEVAEDIAADIEDALITPSPRTSFRCFPAGTQISMSNGKQKNIEDMRAGDHVLSCDEHTKETIPAEVLELIKDTWHEHFVLNDGLLSITGEHPLYIRKKNGTEDWATINQTCHQTLAVGDEVFTKTGEWISITAITHVPGDIDVFNLKLTSPHTFFAGGVLVHNKVVDSL